MAEIKIQVLAGPTNYTELGQAIERFTADMESRGWVLGTTAIVGPLHEAQ